MRWNNTRLGKAAGKNSTAAKRGYIFILHCCIAAEPKRSFSLPTGDKAFGICGAYISSTSAVGKTVLYDICCWALFASYSAVCPPPSLLFATTHLANTLQSRGNGLSTSPCPAQQFSILSSCAIGKGEGRASLQVDDKTRKLRGNRCGATPFVHHIHPSLFATGHLLVDVCS